jgi:hypothetical protein
MWNAGLVLVAMLLSACASRSTVSCEEKFSADSPAIQARVLAAHPAVQPINVLKCVAVSTRTGFSMDPDEEACLVQIAPDSVPRAADPASRLLATPQAVLKLSPDIPDRSHVVALNEGGAAVYRTFNAEQVVLYAPYIRCAETLVTLAIPPPPPLNSAAPAESRRMASPRGL